LRTFSALADLSDNSFPIIAPATRIATMRNHGGMHVWG
jgi:hypothetical protein